MGRTPSVGIAFYPTKCDHTRNKKVRLLYIEHGGDGYWVWKCLLDYIYYNKGYYMDTNNREEMLLFASEHCKQPPEFVQRVILTCIQYGLFSKDVYNSHGVLTSETILETYLYATYDRRRKGSRIFLDERYCCFSTELLDCSTEKWFYGVYNLQGNPLLHGATPIIPRNNSLFPQIKTQSRVEYSKVEYSRDIPEINSGEEKKEGIKGEEKVEQAPEKPKRKSREKKEDAPPPPKKVNPDATPHWDDVKRVWENIYHHVKDKKYVWRKMDYSHLKNIAVALETINDGEWSLGKCINTLNNFFSTASMMPWIKDHYQLPVLYSKINEILSYKPHENLPAEKRNGVFKSCLDKYKVFYQKQTDVPPLINSNEEKSLDKLIAHLRYVTADHVNGQNPDDVVVSAFDTILNRWDCVSEPYRDKLNISNILFNINHIIQNIKTNGKANGKTRTNGSYRGQSANFSSTEEMLAFIDTALSKGRSH